MLVSQGPLAYCSLIKLAAIAAGGASIAEHVAGRGDAPKGVATPRWSKDHTQQKKSAKNGNSSQALFITELSLNKECGYSVQNKCFFRYANLKTNICLHLLMNLKRRRYSQSVGSWI